MDFLPLLESLRDDIWESRVKLVRHASRRWDLEAIIRAGVFPEYEGLMCYDDDDERLG